MLNKTITHDLLTGKFEQFKGLNYPCKSYFLFMFCLENVVHRHIDEKYLMVLGTFPLDKILAALLQSPDDLRSFASFLPNKATKQQQIEVLEILLKSYINLQGKDFSFKILAKNSLLKALTRQT